MYNLIHVIKPATIKCYIYQFRQILLRQMWLSYGNLGGDIVRCHHYVILNLNQWRKSSLSEDIYKMADDATCNRPEAWELNTNLP